MARGLGGGRGRFWNQPNFVVHSSTSLMNNVDKGKQISPVLPTNVNIAHDTSTSFGDAISLRMIELSSIPPVEPINSDKNLDFEEQRIQWNICNPMQQEILILHLLTTL